MKKALIAAGLSLTLIVAGAAGSASAAKGGNSDNSNAKTPAKWTVSVADDEITEGETATVAATISRDKAGRNSGTAMLALGDGCTGGVIAPSATQSFTFPKFVPNNPKSNDVTVEWTVSGLSVGVCEVTVAVGESGKPYSALGEGMIKVNAEGDDVVTGSASWLLSGLALGLLGLGTGSLMLSRRRMI